MTHKKREKSVPLKRAASVRRKTRLIEAYKNSLGNVSKSCEAIGISRETFYRWRKADKRFAEKINDIDEASIDLAETMLLKNIRDGKETSLIFYLKTKGKKRGYIEEATFDHTLGGNPIFQPLQIEVIDSRDKVRNDTDDAIILQN